MDEDPKFTRGGSATGLVRRPIVVLATVAAVVAVTLGYSTVATPLYQSTSEVLVNIGSTSGVFEPIDDQSTRVHRALLNEARFATSANVGSAVEATYGTGDASVTVDARTSDDVLEISVVSSAPQRASDVANAYAVAYIEEREQSIIHDIVETSTVIEQHLRQLEIEVLTPNLSDAERQALQNQIAALTETQDNLQLGLQRSGEVGAVIITPAVPGTSPVSPRTRRNVAVGAIVGLIIGLGATQATTTDHRIPDQ